MSKRVNNRKDRFLQERKEYVNIIKQSGNLIKFNFKFFSSGDGYGQSFGEWQKDEILAEMNDKLAMISGKTKLELMQESVLELYSNYPLDSCFSRPKALESIELKWARIRLTGKRRLIGFFFPAISYDNENGCSQETDTNVFYVVFLDKEHMFAPYHKKNT